MKAAIVHAAGQPPRYADFAEPAPREGEILVDVAAAALSQITRSRAAGAHYSAAAAFPFVAGIDGVGRAQDGTRLYFVLPRAPFGAMAERTVVPRAQCIALPDDLDDVTAAALANPALSSWAALTQRAVLRSGETVLINGATGVSGRLAVQIAKHLGAGRVIATGRNAQALRALAALGADATLQLGDDGEVVEKRFMAEFAQGVDVVIDYLWGQSAQRLLIAAARAGADGAPIRFVQVGSVSGAEIALNSAVLRSSAISMMGSGIGSVGLDRLAQCLSEIFAAAVPGGFKIDAEALPLAQVERGWASDGAARIVFTL